MSRKMLIDASHPEETRVVIVDANRVEDFDFESATKKQIRGNIYLARVTRVEPSLQAAFVEYGGNKHGFLAFNEIHPDYYQIPHEDRLALREAEAAIQNDGHDEPSEPSESQSEGDEDELTHNEVDDDELVEEAARKRRQLLRKYKIQEVIKRRQVLLVQVAKEERGNKGAALTTYLSLAGRYCVLMPNTARGGGISRKITNAADRKQLKSAVAELNVPGGIGLIIRTAGASRTKTEIKRDYDYLIRLWETIRELTLKSTAPSLIYEEGNLVKRAIRDLYDKDIDEVLIEGDEAYREAKTIMRMLMPSHAKKVQPFKEDMPLFLRHQVETQLEAIYSPVAQLKSGGYLVINPTEALVSIDVNSGKSTKERNIEQTALRTNLEAAEEAARQMRLRDLAGLLVIDFIDMEESKNVRAVEKKMKDALKRDRARIQTGRISQFGLMELSRQRRRTSLIEGSTQVCAHCSGTGVMRSVESSALLALRTLEEEGLRGRTSKVILKCAPEVAIYVLNEKRDHLRAVEARFDMRILIISDDSLIRPHYTMERLETRAEPIKYEPRMRPATAASVDDGFDDDAIDDVEDEAESEAETETEIATEAGSRESSRPRRRRGRGRSEARRDEQDDSAISANPASEEAEPGAEEDGSDDGEDNRATNGDGLDSEGRPRKRRRRGRRGGRGRRRREGEAAEGSAQGETRTEGDPEQADVLPVLQPVEGDDLSFSEAPPKRTRPARRRRGRSEDGDAAATPAGSDADASAAEDIQTPEPAADEGADKAPRRRRRRKVTGEAETSPEAKASAEPASQGGSESAENPPAEPAPKTPARRRKAAAPAEEAAATAAPKPRNRAKPKPKSDEAEPAAKAPTRRRKAVDPAPAPAAEAEPADEPAADAPKPAKAPASGEKPKRGWWQRSSDKLFGRSED